GVTPSRFLNWFQATAAARNAGKRLPTNAEWQAAPLGTPDGTPCNVGGGVVSRREGDHEMRIGRGSVRHGGQPRRVGDRQGVADHRLSTVIVHGTNDVNCLAGVETNAAPGARFRGGRFGDDQTAGVFAANGNILPVFTEFGLGFRGA